jgi:hypothetical protein
MNKNRQDKVAGNKQLQYMLLAFACCLPVEMFIADAEAATTTLRVTAKVLSFFRMQVDYQATALTVTPNDIARGYVEAPAATNFSVETNTQEGYIIDFRPRGNLFNSVVITGLPQPVAIGPQGGSAQYDLAHGRTTTHQLSYRFLLRPDVQPGSYGWPLEISVRSA